MVINAALFALVVSLILLAVWMLYQEWRRDGW